MIFHFNEAYRKKYSAGLVKLMSSIFLFSLEMTQVKIYATELWPPQPDKPKFFASPRNIDSPPYAKDKLLVLTRTAYFFKTRLSLDEYKNDPLRLPFLIETGLVKKLLRGHRITTREIITSYEGQVTDEKLGDGYIVMTSRF